MIYHDKRKLSHFFKSGNSVRPVRFPGNVVKFILFPAVLILLSSGLIIKPAQASKGNEVWCYLMEHEIKNFTGKEPITDLFLFSANIDYKGNLYGLAKKPSLPKGADGMRIHLVVTLFGNATLMDLILDPGSSYQKKVISDIVKFSKDYDGVQIDFESMPKEFGPNFTKFLSKLKHSLGKEKIFSVALQAKKSSVRNAFDYAAIGKIADKVLVMAYDQHWSTSDPGPVAELAWCESIVDYTMKEIDPSKIIMGIPLYGRSWENVNHSRAVRYPSVSDWMAKNEVLYNGHDETDPYVKFRTTIDVTVYFETSASIMKKIEMYEAKKIRGIGFWRLTMEPENFWDAFRVKYLN